MNLIGYARKNLRELIISNRVLFKKILRKDCFVIDKDFNESILLNKTIVSNYELSLTCLNLNDLIFLERIVQKYPKIRIKEVIFPRSFENIYLSAL